MSEAIAAAADNPHSLPNTTTVLTIGRWILRLHLAHYCLTGRYPTWVHCVWDLSLQRNQSTRISDPPNSHPLVAKLILIQAGATLAQSFARRFASYMASKQIASTREQHELCGPTNLLSLQLCGICRMPRIHSAIPSSCGHVFCWTCLYQWVSTVRPKCPLCRSACRPQDIVALYNYAP
jgi:Ring finger domain